MLKNWEKVRDSEGEKKKGRPEAEMTDKRKAS